MQLKTMIMTVVMSLILGGAAFAQQETAQDGFLGIGEGQEQMQQTFTGIVDKAGDEHVLIVGDRAYQLDVDDEEMVEGMMGQEVEVRGILEEETIQAESINPAGQMQEQPMGGTEQPMEGQEGNQTGW